MIPTIQIFFANFDEFKVVDDEPWGRVVVVVVAAAGGVDDLRAVVDPHPVLVSPSW